MNMFDDLADPLGAPAGDALGTVLARARRRRAVHRSAAAFAAVVAVVAVVAVGASANALRGSHSGTVHVANGARPTTAPAPTTTTTAAPNGTTPETRPATGSGPWSDRTLTITPQSLGAVRVGMTQGEARTAAAFSFDAGGDGFVYPTTLPAGFPHDYVGMAGSYGKERVVCVGASLWSGSKPSSQTISTPEGLHLGDTVQRLQAIYGTRARYVPAPSSGMTTNAGYVVADPGGYLVFVVGRSLTNWLPPTDRTSGRVVEIAGAVTQNPMSMRPTFGPNSCTG